MVQHIEKLPEKAYLKTFIGGEEKYVCPNHSAFKKHNCFFFFFFFKVQNLQGTPAGGLKASSVPSPYFGQLWGRQAYEKLIAEVNPTAESVVGNQGGGLELSAISPRSCTAGFSSKESSLRTSSPAISWPLLSWLAWGQVIVELHPCLVSTLSRATFHSWPLLGTTSWSFGRTHLTTEEEHFLTEELTASLCLFKSLKRCIYKSTSVFYYLRHSCATFRSSASHFPSSTAPQFWNCLNFRCFSQ